MLLKAILIGLIAAYGCFDYQLGTLYAFRPITLGPLVGLVLGDLKTGVEIGATLELMFMGFSFRRCIYSTRCYSRWRSCYSLCNSVR